LSSGTTPPGILFDSSIEKVIMKTKSILFFLVLLTLPELPAFAQTKSGEGELAVRNEYRNAVGIRAGRTSGITFKHFLNGDHALEGILGIWPNALGVTGLYQKHTPTGINGLKFYYGGGGHLTFETNRYYYRYYNNRNEHYVYRYGRNGLAAGIDGVAGLDYKIGVIPLALSLDIKPFLEVSNYGVVYVALDAGLGIKIAF
jgi:hypothetical protein